MSEERTIVQDDASIERIVDNLTLFDDDLMSLVFDGNIPATELILTIILGREDIEVVSVDGQKELENPLVSGRNIRVDISVRDSSGKFYNVEVQRSSAGADERRARFHSSMVDSRMLKAGQEFKELLESYIIFITKEDYFDMGLPIYTVNRYIEEISKTFQDGSHIIYVNGSYRKNDAIGRLMHDFNCKEAKDMYYQELAKGLKHYKEEGGREIMCQAVKEYANEVAARAAIKTAIKTAIKYGIKKEQIIADVCEEFGAVESEAENLYEAYMQGENVHLNKLC